MNSISSNILTNKPKLSSTPPPSQQQQQQSTNQSQTSGSTQTSNTNSQSTSAAAAAPTTATASSIPSNYGGFAHCANCGEYGVKAAFYGKSKLYCSVACQSGIKKSNNQQQQSSSSSTSTTNSNKRTHDLMSHHNNTETSSLTISIQNDKTMLTSQPQTQLPPTPTTPSNNKIQKLSHQTTQSPIIQTLSNSNSFNFNQIPSTQQQQQQQQQITTVVKSPNLTTGFSWPYYIEYEHENAEAAPVYAFKHVPLSEFWNKITSGIKIEVPNRDFSDCDDKYNYWFATVVKYAGYLVKLRYVGFEDISSKDFWVHLCDPRIQPVGWSAENDVPLIPPPHLADKIDDWKGYLLKNLTGFKTLPKNFHRRVTESLGSRFKRGMLLELVDKKKLSRMKVSRIIDNIGGRLRMKYENSEDFDDFWCHQNSELIHPIGWSAFNGHDIDASVEYKRNSLEKYKNNTYEANECTINMFKRMRPLAEEKAIKQFKPNMKLEAIDPLNLSAICVATIGKVLKNEYLMIRIDGCKSEDGSDMFCYSRTSSSLFPAGFCQMNNIPLQAPYDYKGEFNWETYLRETNSEFAPAHLFYSDPLFENPFKVGMKLESVDLMEPKMICVATIVTVIDRLIRLNFDGWDSDYDQWVDCESCDIYPVGWCQLVQYQLEPPRKADLDNSMTNKKKSKKTKRLAKK